MGLMQLMPGTWAAMRRQHGLGGDPYDPCDNILAGAAYLRAMYDRFGYPGLFAAYNAGPARYERHLRTGQALPAETRDYIAQLAKVPATPSMPPAVLRSEEHTSELQSLMRISYAVFCLKKKKYKNTN